MLYNKSSLYYWGAVILRRGILRGALLRETPEEIMSRCVEHSETGGRPLVKAYSPRQARSMFAAFTRCTVQVNQLTRGELGALGRRLPDRAFRWLAESFGWNLIITAKK
jgi:hypothetical protein